MIEKKGEMEKLLKFDNISDIFVVGICWIEPQICWWSSKLKVGLDFINRDIISLYWTTI